jgi:putative flavoprotein involved in K+ transport
MTRESVEEIEAVIVGGGQAGLAMSEHLGSHGVPHLVLERGRIAERWRSERWDSLVANGPAWHDRFPGMEYPECEPDGFPGKEEIADYFVGYAEKISAPMRCGVTVTEVTRVHTRPGFRVETSDGVIHADYVVAATGPFQRPVIPAIVPDDAGIVQLHSNAYRNPDQLPAGAVLVVGGGSSGAQIADELLRAGRRVYLSVSSHGRPPRSYRGRDFVWWLGVLNKWDMEAAPGAKHTTIAVSGAQGGLTVDFRRLADQGMTLVGTTKSFDDGVLTFAADLAGNLAKGDQDYLSLLDEADAYVRDYGVELPEEPTARAPRPDPSCVTDPILELNLADADIRSIVWATGFVLDFSWLKTDAVDAKGQPVHHRGVSAEPGIYFCGLPWQTRRGSSFIWGVWYDAKYVADHISKQRAYVAYQPAARAMGD